MAKSFRKFREDYDDEWGTDDDDFRRKDNKMKHRRDKKRQKMSEKYSPLLDDENS